MNPLTNMKNVSKLSEQELYTRNKTSWHDQYKDSAWIFVGGLPFDLTEGDIVCIFSQYGEVVNINLIRDKDSGKSKGFCFLCYEDQRSTVLAVDNFNGIKVLNRILRVDHVTNYKVPKDSKKLDTETRKLYEEGCAPNVSVPKIASKEYQDIRETLADQIEADIKLPARLPILPVKIEVKDELSTTDLKEEKKISRKGSSSILSDASSIRDSKNGKKYRQNYEKQDIEKRKSSKLKYFDESETEGNKKVAKKKTRENEFESKSRYSHSKYKSEYYDGKKYK